MWASPYIEPGRLCIYIQSSGHHKVKSCASQNYFESSSASLSLQQSWWSVAPLSYWSQPQRTLTAHWEWVQSSGGKEGTSLLYYQEGSWLRADWYSHHVVTMVFTISTVSVHYSIQKLYFIVSMYLIIIILDGIAYRELFYWLCVCSCMCKAIVL